MLPDLAQLLEDEGVGTVGTNIFMSERPDAPDDCLTISDYSGEGNRLHGNTNVPADERFSVQVMARSKSYVTAWSLAESAFTAISFRHKTLNSGRRYAWSRANQSPAYIGIDQNDRKLVTFNVMLRRHRSTDLT